MSTFTNIRNLIRKEPDIIPLYGIKYDVDHPKALLLTMYMSQIVYFSNEFISASLAALPYYKTHKFYDISDTEALYAEFDSDVFVSFRGTERNIKDVTTTLLFWQSNYNGTKAHRGFVKSLHDVKDGLLENIQKAAAAGKKIHYVGHSMGGALATLLCVEHKPTTCVVFGCPKVLKGKAYKEYFDTFAYLRVNNKWDFIPLLPPSLPFILEYRHVGKQIKLHKSFSFLKNHFIREYIKSVITNYKIVL